MEQNNKKTIVVIDDSHEILEIINTYLTNANKDYEIILFDRVNDVINHINLNPDSLNLLICDLIMPEMTGLDLVKQLKNLENIPVLFITASEDDELVAAAYKLNDRTLKIGYIKKPFNKLMFLSEVDTLISLQEKTLNLIEQNKTILNLIDQEKNKSEYLGSRLKKVLKTHEQNSEKINTIRNLIKNIFTNDLPLIKIIAEIIDGSQEAIAPIVKMADEEFFRIIPYTGEPLRTVAADLECVSEILLELNFVTYEDLDIKNIEKTIFFNMLDKLYKNGKLETETFNKLLDKIKLINNSVSQVFLF